VSESSRSSRFSHSSNHSTRHSASRSANQSAAESSHRPADKREYSDRQNSFHRLPLSINLSTMVVFPASLPPLDHTHQHRYCCPPLTRSFIVSSERGRNGVSILVKRCRKSTRRMGEQESDSDCLPSKLGRGKVSCSGGPPGPGDRLGHAPCPHPRGVRPLGKHPRSRLVSVRDRNLESVVVQPRHPGVDNILLP